MDNTLHYTSVSHAHSLMASVNRMRLDSDLCDVILIVGSFRIQAHRIVLSASAPYFYQLFMPRPPPATLPEYHLEDVDVTAALKIIEFCYTSTISLDEVSVWPLLSAATKFECREISGLCWDFLGSELSVSTCLPTHLMACKFKNETLLSSSGQFVANNIEKVITSPALFGVSSQELVELGSSLSSHLSQENMLKLLTSWLNRHLDKRSEVAGQLMDELPKYRSGLQYYLKQDIPSREATGRTADGSDNTHLAANTTSTNESFKNKTEKTNNSLDQETSHPCIKEDESERKMQAVPLHICVSCGDVLDSQVQLEEHQQECSESAQPLARRMARQATKLSNNQDANLEQDLGHIHKGTNDQNENRMDVSSVDDNDNKNDDDKSRQMISAEIKPSRVNGDLHHSLASQKNRSTSPSVLAEKESHNAKSRSGDADNVSDLTEGNTSQDHGMASQGETGSGRARPRTRSESLKCFKNSQNLTKEEHSDSTVTGTEPNTLYQGFRENDTNNNDINQWQGGRTYPTTNSGKPSHDRGTDLSVGLNREETLELNTRLEEKDKLGQSSHRSTSPHEGQMLNQTQNQSVRWVVNTDSRTLTADNGRTSPQKLKCQICDCFFRERKTLAAHWRLVHGLVQETSSPAQPSSVADLTPVQSEISQSKPASQQNTDPAWTERQNMMSRSYQAGVSVGEGGSAPKKPREETRGDNVGDLSRRMDSEGQCLKLLKRTADVDTGPQPREMINGDDTTEMMKSYLQQYKQFTRWCLDQGATFCPACQSYHPLGVACPGSLDSRSGRHKQEEGQRRDGSLLRDDSMEDNVKIDVVGDEDVEEEEEGPLDMSKTSQDFGMRERATTDLPERMPTSDVAGPSGLDLSQYYTNYALLMAAAASGGGQDNRAFSLSYSDTLSRLGLTEGSGDNVYKPYMPLPTSNPYPLNLTSDSGQLPPAGGAGADNPYHPTGKGNSSNDVSSNSADAPMPSTSHRRKLSSRQGFPCTVCSRVFSYQAALFTHMRTHSPSARTYQCQLCQQTFARAPDLKVHVCPNGVEKPYTCPSCGQTFAKNIHLKRHLATHSGLKPYPCWVCGKRFSRSDHLKRHTQSIHAGSRPHGCHICGKEFVRKYELNKHMTLHSLDTGLTSATMLQQQQQQQQQQRQQSPAMHQHNTGVPT